MRRMILFIECLYGLCIGKGMSGKKEKPLTRGQSVEVGVPKTFDSRARMGLKKISQYR